MSNIVWTTTEGWHDGSNVEVSIVAALGERDELTFVSDSQDAESVREHVGAPANGYDSFFVRVAGGDYSEVWGMAGIVPYRSKLVTRLV